MSERFIGGFIATEKVTQSFSRMLSNQLRQLKNAPYIGAITTFIGVVRKVSSESRHAVDRMEVECWEEKGDEVMTFIATEIGKKHNLLGVRLYHVFGTLKVSDPIVFINIASSHRQEAFQALSEIIIAYKTKSPVWKKEIYSDGSSKWITTTNQNNKLTSQ